MFEQMNEEEARNEILESVAAYYEKYRKNRKPFEAGDRIPYASRVYDEKEILSCISFRLTSVGLINHRKLFILTVLISNCLINAVLML